MLVIAIYLLRLAGQGMMSHTAMTAMGRWFVAERGRAVAVTSGVARTANGTNLFCARQDSDGDRYYTA